MKWQVFGSKPDEKHPGHLLGDVPPELQDLIPGFVERREEEVLHLKEFLAIADFNAIMEVGHRIKGSGTNYGFESISLIGQKMEIAASSKRSGTWPMTRYLADPIHGSGYVPRKTGS